jgi:hypothetical protein
MLIRAKKLNLAIAGSVIGLFCYKTFKIYLARKKFRHIPGPPTHGILGFYLGNLDELVAVMNSGKILADLILEW